MAKASDVGFLNIDNFINGAEQKEMYKALSKNHIFFPQNGQRKFSVLKLKSTNFPHCLQYFFTS